MKRYLFQYAALRKDTDFDFVVPALSVAMGVLLAAAVIPRTPPDTIRGYGDAALLSGTGASFLSAYWKCSRYHIIAALLSTSFLGTFAIPVVLAYRGFALSCASAAVMLDYPSGGALFSALFLGIPAVITVPSLIWLSGEAMASSRDLFCRRFAARPRLRGATGLRNMLFSFAVLIPAAVLEATVLPALAAILVNSM